MQKSLSIPTMIKWHTFAISILSPEIDQVVEDFSWSYPKSMDNYCGWWPSSRPCCPALRKDDAGRAARQRDVWWEQRSGCNALLFLHRLSMWSIQVVGIGSAFSWPHRALCHCSVWINLKKSASMNDPFFKLCSWEGRTTCAWNHTKLSKAILLTFGLSYSIALLCSSIGLDHMERHLMPFVFRMRDWWGFSSHSRSQKDSVLILEFFLRKHSEMYRP